MTLGSLEIITTTASKALPLEFVNVEITLNNGDIVEIITNEEGKTDLLEIEAPDKELSLNINYQGIPYTIVNVVAQKDGFEKVVVSGVQIFADEKSLVELDMSPIVYLQSEEKQVKKIDIPENILLRTVKYSLSDTAQANEEHLLAPIVLDYPIIPKTVTVHLGRPTAYARNVTVTFKDYIKNVASSEIYPTWPTESLKANILAQISILLNRVYTEWYRGQGYDFDITNSTAFDQYFVEGRNIFDTISNVVDSIFNQYIQKINTVNPYYAEYCDGKIAQCSGMKQWGTVTLAEQGRNALEILKYYYGNDIKLITTDRIEGVSGSFPGFSLRNGVKSDAVATIQNQLNRIAVNYPLIPTIYPVDGIYGPMSEASVKVFQKQFNLTQDGIVGNATWYKIGSIYVAVKKLAELGSEGVEDRLIFEYPGFAIREGDRSVYVQEIQFFIQKIALFTTSVPSVKIDSNFGSGTRFAVQSFQRLAGLSQDGIVGEKTWSTFVQAYRETLNVGVPSKPLMPDYPGVALRRGSSGENVRILQNALNEVNKAVGNLSMIAVDGIFGSGTESAVKYYQSRNNLVSDGIVGRLTWNSIKNQYTSIRSNPLAYSEANFELSRFLYDSSTSLMYDTNNNKRNI